MSHTKTRPKADESQSELLELQIRIACTGKSAADALEELRRGLADGVALGRHPLVVLEDLGKLQDSVVTFVKGLSRMLVDYPGSVTFWETSGYTEAFLSVMERGPRNPR